MLSRPSDRLRGLRCIWAVIPRQPKPVLDGVQSVNWPPPCFCPFAHSHPGPALARLWLLSSDPHGATAATWQNTHLPKKLLASSSLHCADADRISREGGHVWGRRGWRACALCRILLLCAEMGPESPSAPHLLPTGSKYLWNPIQGSLCFYSPWKTRAMALLEQMDEVHTLDLIHLRNHLHVTYMSHHRTCTFPTQKFENYWKHPPLGEDQVYKAVQGTGWIWSKGLSRALLLLNKYETIE